MNESEGWGGGNEGGTKRNLQHKRNIGTPLVLNPYCKGGFYILKKKDKKNTRTLFYRRSNNSWKSNKPHNTNKTTIQIETSPKGMPKRGKKKNNPDEIKQKSQKATKKN